MNKDRGLIFKNNNTGETFSHAGFVTLVWDVAEKMYESLHHKLWCDLTFAEQVILYCREYELMLNSDWQMEFI